MTDSFAHPSPDQSSVEASPLHARGARLADYRSENRMLSRLMMGIAQSRPRMMQAVVDAAMVICDAQSAGFSALDRDSGEMCWAVVRGAWAASEGRSVKGDGSPCDLAMRRANPLLLIAPDLPGVPGPAPIEILVVPCPGAKSSCGTLWVVQHDDARQFDAEDLRLLTSMGRLASLAWALRSAEVETAGTVEEAEDLNWFDTGVYETISRAARQGERVNRWERTEERIRILMKEGDQQRRLFDALLVPATTIACAWDTDRRFIYANDQALRHWRRDRDSVVGTACRDLQVDQWPAREIDQAINEVLSTALPVRGSDATVLYLLMPVLDQSGAVEAIVCICETLSAPGDQSHEEQKLVLSGAPSSIFLFDHHLRARYVNPAAQQLLDLGNEGVGQDAAALLSTLWSSEYVTEVEWILRHVLETGNPYFTPEHTDDDRGGVVRHYEWQAQRVTLPDGSHGLTCWLRDISGHANLRIALEAKTKVAEEAQRRSDELLAILTRELRRPLEPLLESLRTFMRTSDPQQRLTAGTIMELRLQTLDEIANDLQDLVRIAEGRIEPRKMPLELARIIRHAVESIKTPSVETKVEVVPGDPGLRVIGDPIMLLEAFTDLIDDAVRRAGFAGGVSIVLEQPDAGQVEVRITGQRSADPEVRAISVEPTMAHAMAKTRIALHAGRVEDYQEPASGAFSTLVTLPSPPMHTRAGSTDLTLTRG